MTILSISKDSFDTATIPANKSTGFDPNAINLVITEAELSVLLPAQKVDSCIKALQKLTFEKVQAYN